MSASVVTRCEIPPVAAPKAVRSRGQKLFRWVERLLASIGLSFIIYHLAFELTVMTSESMAPALQGTSFENGDRILLEKVTGWIRAPRRWEIYFFYDSDGNPVAKRVAGLPGEKISIKNRRVYINGAEIPRPKALQSIQYFGYGTLAHDREVDCESGYFMLGDASVDSLDSRYTGLVAKERLRGRVLCVVSPRDRIGFVR